MKKIEYHCDGHGCKSFSVNNDLPIGWIGIGSVDGHSLKITNKLESAMLNSMDKHTDIHFCSIKCLTDRLVAQ